MVKVLDTDVLLSNRGIQATAALRMRSGARYLATSWSSPVLVCRTYDAREVSVCDVSTGQVRVKDFQAREVMQPVLSPDGSAVLLNTYNAEQQQPHLASENLLIYSTATGARVSAISVNSLHLRTYTFSESGALVLTHSENTVKSGVELVLWDCGTGRKQQQMQCELGGVSALFCLHDDRFVVTLHNYSGLELKGETCDLRVFDAATGEQRHHSSGYVRDTLTPIAMTSRFYVARGRSNQDNRVCVFDLDTLQLSQLSIGQVGKLYIDRAGGRGIDGALQVLDLSNDVIISCFADLEKPQFRQNPQTYPKISPDGRYVAWLSMSDSCVLVGCVETRSLIGRAFIHSTPLSLRLCHDNVVAVGSEEGYILLYDIVHGADDTARARRRILQGDRRKHDVSRM